VHLETARQSLEGQRSAFRQTLPADPEGLWRRFTGRIAVVLSGGGARGAYEAGVLLAFQDACLPTHILTATSIGSINAGSYAAHSDTLVGNADSLVNSWYEVTPAAVGIDWSRYVFILAGLIAASAGLGNFLIYAFGRTGIYFHLRNPMLTWFILFLAGLSVVFFYDQLSYAFHVLARVVKGGTWKPDGSKLAASILGNAVVWGFAVFFFTFAHLHLTPTEIFHFRPETAALALAGVLLGVVLWWLLRNRISQLSRRFLRLPLRSGLFPNFERTRFLRARIPADKLRASPMRVLMTAAEVRSGTESFFVNRPLDELLSDPGVDAKFVRKRVEPAEDLLKAIIASSAYPMAYELIEMQGRLWTDGGICAKQPILPAIRLGADVLFSVLVEAAEEQLEEIKTFLDVGLRTFDILISRNLRADLNILENVNRICEKCAADLGVRPEQVVLEIGDLTYRYVKAFTVRPAASLAVSWMDFDGATLARAIEQGYCDGAVAVREFINYVRDWPADMPKHVLRLRAEHQVPSIKYQVPST